jgi:hypothetical protein
VIALAQAGAASGASHAEIRERTAEILARPEFLPRTPGITDWLGKQVRAFFEWLGDLFDFDASSLPIPIEVLYGIAIAIVLVGVVLLIRRLVTGARRGTTPRDSGAIARAARAARAAELLADARTAAQRGDLTSAARLYFWALVIGLSERGAIEYRAAWTCREALERGAPSGEIQALLAPLVPRLDAVSFGRAPVHASDVDELAALCHRWLAGSAA